MPKLALYLHYLDRELNQSVGLRLLPEDVIRRTRTLAVLTSVQLYCGLSALWENDAVRGASAVELEQLMHAGALGTVSSDSSQIDFLDARRVAYEHDRSRYPRYFLGPGELAFDAFVPTWPKATGSTAPLEVDLLGWSRDLAPSGSRYRAGALEVGGPVRRALMAREGQALTYSYFRPWLGDLAGNSMAESAVRRRISRSFTHHNMHFFGGDIPTGIPQLQWFDDLADDFPLNDLPVLGMLATAVGASELLDPHVTGPDRAGALYLARSTAEAARCAAAVQWLLGALAEHDRAVRLPGPRDDPFGWAQPPAVRARLAADLRAAMVELGPQAPPPGDDPREIYAGLYRGFRALAAAAARRMPVLGGLLEAKQAMLGAESADVLLVTATPVETEALHAALSAAGWRPRLEFGPVDTYTVWEGAAATKVVTVRSSIGSKGAGGSAMTTDDAIGRFKPVAVIAVGIAFGMNPKKQPLGAVLVSQRLIDYERVRAGTGPGGALEIRERGDRVPAHPLPLGRFQSAGLAAAGFEMRFGDLVTGDKLVDNAAYRDALLARFPDAVGGEMEGSGILDAASRRLLPWLIVKAVCDHAANKGRDKNRRQQAAAAAAAGAVVHVLSSGAFADR